MTLVFLSEQTLLLQVVILVHYLELAVKASQNSTVPEKVVQALVDGTQAVPLLIHPVK